MGSSRISVIAVSSAHSRAPATGDSGHGASPRTLGHVTAGDARTYQIRTYGCQMNVARLRAAGRPARGRGLPARARAARPRTWSCSTPARSGRTPTTGCTATSATCCRSRTPSRACRSPSAAAWPRRTAAGSPHRAPWVDVVFGTHNIGSLPVLLERARVQAAGAGRDRRVAGAVPVGRCPPGASPPTRPGSPISVGCNNTCTFCIVPSLRGQGEGPPPRRRPRRDPGAGRPTGVLEVTLLGQNVNSYGVGVRRPARRSASCCAPAARSTAWSGSGSPRRTRATSPTT